MFRPQVRFSGIQPGLNESKDETILTAVQFDAADMQTGVYPFQIVTTNHYDGSSVGGSWRDMVIVDNRSDSPYGAGWNINGLQRLYIQQDESRPLTDGDGSATFYRALGEAVAQSNFDSDAEGWQPVGDTVASMSAPAHSTELDDSNGYLSASDAQSGHILDVAGSATIPRRQSGSLRGHSCL